MISAIKNGTLDELIKNIEKEAKIIRNVINDIVLYTEGAYNIKDLYVMPVYFINEILERIELKNKKTKEEIDKAKGIRNTTF